MYHVMLVVCTCMQHQHACSSNDERIERLQTLEEQLLVHLVNIQEIERKCGASSAPKVFEGVEYEGNAK